MSLHNPRRKHSIVIPVLLGLVVAAELSIFAWQVDVHYILTFFLATKAGFSRMAADAIAMGNQSVDDTYDAAPTAMIWVLLCGNMTAAHAVQEKHFPSDGPFPSPPQRRVVTPNGPMARWPIESLIHPNPASTALINFGRQMHPFHDSWSHQGVPDVPLRPGTQLRPNLSSAHPESRGGWFSSDADLTYKHPEEVVDLARETYILMRRYLYENPNLRSHPEVPWEDLEPVVRDFAKADTRQKKNDWAAKNIPMVDEVRRQAISTLTLPGASPRQDVRTFWALRPPRGSMTAAAVPSGLVETVNKFVTVWIRNQDVDQAAQFVDLDTLGELFRGSRSPLGERVPSALEQWSKRFLMMYLVADHVAVNAAGFANPEHERYESLPISKQETGLFQVVAEFRAPVLTSEDFVLLNETPPGPGFAVVLRMSDLPYEAVAFVWRETDNRWAITSMFAAVG